ncbi:MAG: AbrB/MazE/SpoVT family DNA-binding domain-containing protein [Patescibacteria group bacterium]
MTYTVSITSQGQISIPAKIRRELGLSKTKKAIVSVENGKMTIEPVKDFLELAGSLKNARRAKVSPREMREAFEQYLADEAMGKNE